MSVRHDLLQAHYARAFPDKPHVQVGELIHLDAGWESDIYAFDVEHGPAGNRQREELILRLYPGADAVSKATAEFHGLQRLHQAGYPVPRVDLLAVEDSPLGSPFVLMERIAGQVMWPLLFRSAGRRQREMLTLFCRLFVQLHTLDWEPFVDDREPYRAENPYVLVEEQLARWQPYVEQFPNPDFLPAWEWLLARRREVPCRCPAVVHWDFHPENILLRDDGSAVVIDWTGLNVTDPRFDLAWTLLLITTYEGSQWREPILREYERLRGAAVEQLSFFDVAACLRRLFSIVASLSSGAESMGMRPGAEEQMRGQREPLRRVYDLLQQRTGLRVPIVEWLLESM